MTVKLFLLVYGKVMLLVVLLLGPSDVHRAKRAK